MGGDKGEVASARGEGLGWGERDAVRRGQYVVDAGAVGAASAREPTCCLPQPWRIGAQVLWSSCIDIPHAAAGT